MSQGMTLASLLDAIQHFLREIARNPEQHVDQEKGLTLWGKPGDDEMRTLLELFGGTLKITVCELPTAMQQIGSELAPENGSSLNVWHPDEEQARGQPVSPGTNDSGERSGPRSEDSRSHSQPTPGSPSLAVYG